MTRYGLLVAVPALALGVPAFAQLQPVADVTTAGEVGPPAGQAQTSPITVRTDPVTGQTVATMVLAPAATPVETAPVGRPAELVPAVQTPGFVWVPGHYNWDPVQRKYIWLVGQYVQPPREQVRWISGHWRQEPAGWVWIDGRWN